MSYVKKYEVGNVRLDAPYAHYIYELPLLSFSDIRNSIGLSLVYQSKLDDNPFYIKNGFKLNLQKRLIMDCGTYPKNYEDCDGTLVSLNNFVNHFTFNDDSQRIIRYVNEQYILENPDFSTEIYNSSGKIIAIKDKYGSEYLSYTYTSGKLTSINYRNSKYINLSYYTEGSYSGQLKRIDFVCGETCVSSTFIYSNSGIKIQHYSGVDYHFVFSGNTLTLYSTDRNEAYSNAYSHKLICNLDSTNHKIVVSAYVGEKEVDQNTYDCLGVNSQNKFMAVNIKDFNGVITRVQYENDKPCYSYEITDTADEPSYRDIFFEDTNSNFIYKGNVSINTDTFSGVQGVNSGCKMSDISIDNISSWEYIFSGTESLYGNFIISGWIYAEENATYTVTVKDIYRSIDYEGCTLSNLVPNVWNYFSFKAYMRNPADITVKITETSGFPFCFDVRISFEEGKIYTPTDYNNFTVTKDVLIKEGADSSNAKIIDFDSALRFYNGNNLITEKITASDILKYKINQKNNRYLDELYYDKCKGVSTSNGEFSLEYDEDTNGVIKTMRLNVKDIAVGKVRIHNEKTYLTKMNFYANSNEDDYLFAVTYINGEEIGRKMLDEYFDITSSTMDGVTTVYTRTNGLITSESVQNLYTRTTVYSEDVEGNPTITAKDEFNNTIVYTLDPMWGVVKSTLMPDGTIITDQYDSDMCAIVARIFTDSDGNSKTHTFEYADGNLKELTDGTINYNFTYSAGALSEVFKFDTTPIEKHVLSNGDKTLTSYYPKESGALYSIVQNTDKYGRITSINGLVENTYKVVDDGTYYTITPEINNSSSKLAVSKDLTNGNETKYAYENGRIKKIGVFNFSGTKINEEELTYDAAGRVITDAFTYNNMSNSVQGDIYYATEADSPTADSRVGSYTYKVDGYQKAVTANTYDVYKRIQKKQYRINKTYFSKEIEYDKTRPQRVIDKKATPITNPPTLNDVKYEYDAMGRITCEKDGNNNILKSYTYDTYGQLIRENNKALDKTFVYSYNGIGNVTAVKSYPYTTGTPSGTPVTTSFGYSGDKLTSFGNKSITYNSNGGVTSYDGWNYTWSKGKLSSVRKELGSSFRAINPPLIPNLNSSKTYSFIYNAFGQRVKSNYSYFIANDSITSIGQDEVVEYTKAYSYDNSGRLISESITEELYGGETLYSEIVFLYDESSMVGMQYTSPIYGTSIYYYLRNLQGDVIGIYDTNGNKVVEYAYDAYGNCTIKGTTTNYTVAHVNPIRYRGYYYDEKTKLYYLNARYYSPEFRRFISPDDSSYLDPETPNGLNLYAYCNNDPINYVDQSGHDPEWWQWALFGVGVALVAVAAGMAIFGTGGIAAFGMGALIGSAAVGGAGAVIGGAIGYATGGVDGIFGGAMAGFGIGAIVGFAVGGTIGYHSFVTAPLRSHSVYISKSGNTVNYAGRTNNIVRRTAEHLNAGKGVVPKEVARKLTLKQARGLEQALINRYGLLKNGGTLINKINSIAISNPIYDQAVLFGRIYILTHFWKFPHP